MKRLAYVAYIGLLLLVGGCAQTPITKSENHTSVLLIQTQYNPPPTVRPAVNSFAPPSLPALPSYSSRLLLTDINRIYALNNAELNREITRLSNSTEHHARVKLALLLSRTHQLADTQRALNLLTSVIAQSRESGDSWYIWAQLLYPVLEDQYKLLAQLSQQAHNVRENNRLIEELNRKIEALRAIETNLNTRSP